MRKSKLPCLVVLLFLAGPAHAAECPGSLLGELTEGPVQSLALHAGHLYIGSGATLLTYSLADPSDPVRTSAVQLHDVAFDITPSAGLLFVAAWDAGVEILDLADPGQPEPLSRYPTTGPVRSVAVSASRAYVLESGTGLRILDVTSPTAPAQLGTWATSLDVAEVEVSGSHAFITATAPESFRGLVIVDVSDPGAPVEVGSRGLGPGSDPAGLAVAGSIAYVAAGDGGLVAFDVSNPQDPTITGQYTGASSKDVVVAGDRAFVVGWAGFRSLDLADPSNPVELGALPAAVGGRVAATAGLAAVGAGQSVGSELLDVSVPATPVPLWSLDAPAAAEGAALAGSSVFLASGLEGLRVVDISDPASPVAIGALDNSGSSYSNSVAVVAQRAYLADGSGGLRIVDVSSPATPAEMSSLSLPGYAYRLAISGSRAYVSTLDAGLRIVSVANPAAPTEIGDFDPGTQIRDLAANGMTVVLASSLGVSILDATTPALPLLVSTLDLPGAVALAMNGNLLAVASKLVAPPRLDLVDLAVPAMPVVLATRPFAGSTHPESALAMTSTRLVIEDPEVGLLLFDVTDPSRPLEVGSYDPPGLGSDVDLAGDLVVSGNTEAGVSILSASAVSSCWLFSDGFESGDSSYWSATEP
jgi:hypothetical protein